MNPIDPDSPLPQQNSSFTTTRWSMVLAAGDGSSPESRKALASLCELYWSPLYAYVCRRVPDVHDAQDLTQAFFAQLLERNYIGQAIAERGRFRAFLLTALKHFLSKEWEKSRALKRGGGRVPLSLDFDKAGSKLHLEASAGLTAEQLYDQEWACVLLDRILDRLFGEYDAVGKPALFRELKGFLIGDRSGTSYARVAECLKITNAAARQAVTRMRRRYRQLLREEIAETVSSPAEVEEEIRNLLTALQL